MSAVNTKNLSNTPESPQAGMESRNQPYIDHGQILMILILTCYQSNIRSGGYDSMGALCPANGPHVLHKVTGLQFFANTSDFIRYREQRGSSNYITSMHC